MAKPKGQALIVSKPKKTRQGHSVNSKLKPTQKKYRGQGK